MPTTGSKRRAGRRSRRRGVSLIEGVLYITISLAVIIGGLTFYNQARLSSEVTATSRVIMASSSYLRSLYGKRPSLAGTSLTLTLVSTQAVPSAQVAPSGEIVLPMVGTLHAFGLEHRFAMILADLEADACQRIAPVSAAGRSLLGTGIIGIQLTDLGASPDDAAIQAAAEAVPASYFGLPYTPLMAAADCTDGVDMVVIYQAS